MAVYEYIEQLKGVKADLKQKFSLTSDDFSDYPELIEGKLPKLNPPTLSASGFIVSVSDLLNGQHSSLYELYVDSVKFLENASGVFDLSSFSVGSYSLSAKAKGSFFNASDIGASITFNVFSVTCIFTNISSDTPEKVASGQNLSATLTATSGYLPRNITVTVGGQSADFSYDCTSGQLTVYSVTGEVVINANASAYPLLATPEAYFINNSIKWQAVTGANSYSVYNGVVLVGTATGTELYLGDLLEGYTEYTLTVVALGSGYQDSLASEGVSVYVENCKVLGVSGLEHGATITRTDDAIGLNYLIRTSTGEIVSDFYDEFPFNEIEVVEKSGNKFVKFPKMYFRITNNANGVLTSVAVSKRPKNEGKWFEVKEFYYGAYRAKTQDGKVNSVSGGNISYNYNLDQLRDMAFANGSGYFLLDLYHRTVVDFLWLIEYCLKGAGVPLGRKNGSSGSYAIGATDSLNTPSGYNTENDQIRYHYIEDFNGSAYEFLDGCVLKNGVLNMSDEPQNYGSTAFHHKVFPYSYTGGHNTKVMEFAWSDEMPFLIYVYRGGANGQYNSTVYDYNNYNQTMYLYTGQGMSYGAASGLFAALFCTITHTGCCTRLMYKESV